MPYVPSQQETKEFISTISDLKLKTMVVLMYSSGLRMGEVRHLRYEDISRKNMRIHITHGKNRSDRYAMLSKYALNLLTQYWYAYSRPTGWLFPQKKNPEKPIDNFYLSRMIHAYEGFTIIHAATVTVLNARLLKKRSGSTNAAQK